MILRAKQRNAAKTKRAVDRRLSNHDLSRRFMPRLRLGAAGVEFSLFTLGLLTANAERPLPPGAGRFVVKTAEKVIGAFGSRPDHGAAIGRHARGGVSQGLEALPGVDQFAALIVV